MEQGNPQKRTHRARQNSSIRLAENGSRPRSKNGAPGFPKLHAAADHKMEQSAVQKWIQLPTPKCVGGHVESEAGGPGGAARLDMKIDEATKRTIAEAVLAMQGRGITKCFLLIPNRASGGRQSCQPSGAKTINEGRIIGSTRRPKNGHPGRRKTRWPALLKIDTGRGRQLALGHAR